VFRINAVKSGRVLESICMDIDGLVVDPWDWMLHLPPERFAQAFQGASYRHATSAAGVVLLGKVAILPTPSSCSYRIETTPM
jgi:hypothetical protein